MGALAVPRAPLSSPRPPLRAAGVTAGGAGAPVVSDWHRPARLRGAGVAEAAWVQRAGLWEGRRGAGGGAPSKGRSANEGSHPGAWEQGASPTTQCDGPAAGGVRAGPSFAPARRGIRQSAGCRSARGAPARTRRRRTSQIGGSRRSGAHAAAPTGRCRDTTRRWGRSVCSLGGGCNLPSAERRRDPKGGAAGCGAGSDPDQRARETPHTRGGPAME